MRKADHRDYRDLTQVFYDNLVSSDLDIDREELIQECVDNILDVNFADEKVNASFARAAGRAVGELIANLYESTELADELDFLLDDYTQRFVKLTTGE